MPSTPASYSTQPDTDYINAMNQELEQLRATQNANYPMPTQFGNPQKQNLVEWQLDFRAEMEDIEHLLRNDVLIKDKYGVESWVENPEKQCIVFNRRGTNEILKEIRTFLNKNTVLSNYQIEEIKERLKMFGHELRALIYNNYEDYGLNTDYKLNHFPITVITILSMVESAYRRALNGEERKDLNSMRMVSQQDNTNQNMGGYSPPSGQQTKKSIFRPWTW